LLIGDDDGVGFEDGVGGKDGGVGDGEVCGSVWSETKEESQDDSEDEERQKDRGQQVASSGLSKLEVRHLQEHSKTEAVSGRLKGKTGITFVARNGS
jgi:hypothetical protein